MYIKKIAYAREASLSDSNKYVRIPRKNKFKTVVLRSNKSPKKAHRYHGIERYFVLCKKAGIPERKYTSYSVKDCTGVCTNRSIKDLMLGTVGSTTDAVKQYKKSENK